MTDFNSDLEELFFRKGWDACEDFWISNESNKNLRDMDSGLVFQSFDNTIPDASKHVLNTVKAIVYDNVLTAENKIQKICEILKDF